MPEIAFIMGKSSSGKDKVFRALAAEEALQLQTVVMYTTRPMRSGETEGVEYHFVDEAALAGLEAAGKIIELRSYHTVKGIWKYFTVDDNQIDLTKGKYLIIGTLEAYNQFCRFYGKAHLLPIYIEVEDGIRLKRAIHREEKQENPNYAELCRRFLADSEDFSEEKILESGIEQRFDNNGELEDCIAAIQKVIKEKM